MPCDSTYSQNRAGGPVEFGGIDVLSLKNSGPGGYCTLVFNTLNRRLYKFVPQFNFNASAVMGNVLASIPFNLIGRTLGSRLRRRFCVICSGDNALQKLHHH
jgi:hypothetical protein